MTLSRRVFDKLDCRRWNTPYLAIISSKGHLAGGPKLQLDTRRNAPESSAPTPERTVALEQIAGAAHRVRAAWDRAEPLGLPCSVGRA
jgi:hypothetical protein